MESSFSLWLKGCEINNTEVYCLDGKGDSGFYKTQSKYMAKWNYYNTTPVYHVWVNGERIAATTNYCSALATWNNHKMEAVHNE